MCRRPTSCRVILIQQQKKTAAPPLGLSDLPSLKSSRVGASRTKRETNHGLQQLFALPRGCHLLLGHGSLQVDDAMRRLQVLSRCACDLCLHQPYARQETVAHRVPLAGGTNYQYAMTCSFLRTLTSSSTVNNTPPNRARQHLPPTRRAAVPEGALQVPEPLLPRVSAGLSPTSTRPGHHQIRSSR